MEWDCVFGVWHNVHFTHTPSTTEVRQFKLVCILGILFVFFNKEWNLADLKATVHQGKAS